MNGRLRDAGDLVLKQWIHNKHESELNADVVNGFLLI